MHTGWLLFAWGLVAPAAAQTALSLKEAVAEALATHPLLAAGTARIEASEGGRRQAGLAPNPRLILQSENTRPYFSPPFRFWHETDSFAFLQQTFETSAKRGHRVEVASANVRRAELERELAARQIAGRIKAAYWQAAGAQEIHDLLLESRKNFQQIVEYHEIRVREGAMAEADLLRVRLEGERLAVAANAALLEAQRSHQASAGDGAPRIP